MLVANALTLNMVTVNNENAAKLTERRRGVG